MRDIKLPDYFDGEVFGGVGEDDEESARLKAEGGPKGQRASATAQPASEGGARKRPVHFHVAASGENPLTAERAAELQAQIARALGAC